MRTAQLGVPLKTAAKHAGPGCGALPSIREHCRRAALNWTHRRTSTADTVKWWGGPYALRSLWRKVNGLTDSEAALRFSWRKTPMKNRALTLAFAFAIAIPVFGQAGSGAGSGAGQSGAS